MSPLSRGDLRVLVGGAVAVAVLAAGSTVALAAAGMGPGERGITAVRGGACTVPALSGTVVHVTLAGMGRMMDGSIMGGSTMGGRGSMTVRRGMARVMIAPTHVPAGTVSLVVANVGSGAHELVVLPLSAGQAVGQRTVGGDGKVDETGSLGEASASCGAGAGDGIAAGSDGWVTLALPAGRYELVCNLTGHYSAGMYAELDVG